MTSTTDSEATGQLLAQARLLRACREIYLSAWADGLADAREGSGASADFRSAETGPGGPWPDWLVPQTRTMAVTLVRQQVDFCVSIGVLIENGEHFEPIYSLTRSAFEFGLRAYWLLEPEVPLRQRCARGRLMELVSVHHLRDAARGRPDTAERQHDIAAMKAGWSNLKASVAAMFADVKLADDPGRWSVEGVRYESWTDVAERWLARAGSTMSGGGIYKHLSVRAHPQGFNATPGFGVGPDGATTRSTSIAELSRLTSIAAVTAYLSLALVTSYHGPESSAVKRLESEIARQFPTLLR